MANVIMMVNNALDVL